MTEFNQDVVEKRGRKCGRKIWKFILDVTLIPLTFLSFYTCGGQTTPISLNVNPSSDPTINDELPDWSPKDTEKYYYGTGESTRSLADAQSEARKELIREIEITIETEITQQDQSQGYGRNERIDNSFLDWSRSYAKQKLSGIEINEEDKKGTKYYARARLSKDRYKIGLEEDMKKSFQAVQYWHKWLDEGNVIHAIEGYTDTLNNVNQYSNALRNARILLNNYEKPADLPNSDEIERSVKEKMRGLPDRIQLLAISGNDQTGKYGSSLCEELVVQARYGDKSLSNFPLKATYTDGIGRLKNDVGETGKSVRIYTNEGQGICWVDAVKSISRKNTVRISVDADGIPFDGAEIPLLKSKAVDFRYTSSFPVHHTADAPVVILKGYDDEPEIAEDSMVDIEIYVTNSCHVCLFWILANGEIEINQQFRISEASNGSGWRILSVEHGGWTFQMDRVPFIAKRGFGVETLLVITTEKKWEPNGQTLTADGLIRRLDESVGAEEWRAGWVSYHLTKKE